MNDYEFISKYLNTSFRYINEFRATRCKVGGIFPGDSNIYKYLNKFSENDIFEFFLCGDSMYLDGREYTEDNLKYILFQLIKIKNFINVKPHLYERMCSIIRKLKIEHFNFERSDDEILIIELNPEEFTENDYIFLIKNFVINWIKFIR